jgi:hypothetical protein
MAGVIAGTVGGIGGAMTTGVSIIGEVGVVGGAGSSLIVGESECLWPALARAKYIRSEVKSSPSPSETGTFKVNDCQMWVSIF